ncbi:MAG: hypothetical protein ACOYYU_09860 [Chloroflexota bacterium]
MNLKKYLTLMLISAMTLTSINMVISFVTYPLYIEEGVQTRSPTFYLVSTFLLSLFHSSFLVALYLLLREKLPGKGLLKGIFYGICVVWLLGPVFALSFELAYNLTVQTLTVTFAATALVSWTLYGLILEVLYGRV